MLGPVLFSLFVNDCPSVATHSKISLYADDTKIYNKTTDTDNVKALQNDLDKVQEWASSMQMDFNAEKCTVLHLGQSNPHQEYNLLNGINTRQTLKSTKLQKDLGVLIDDSLTFATHIKNIVISANKTLGAIRRAFVHMDKRLFQLLYKSLVRPKLEYASI